MTIYGGCNNILLEIMQRTKLFSSILCKLKLQKEPHQCNGEVQTLIGSRTSIPITDTDKLKVSFSGKFASTLTIDTGKIESTSGQFRPLHYRDLIPKI
jgi:hypothetical protein